VRNLGTRRIVSHTRELLPTTRNAEDGSRARVGRSRKQYRLWKARIGEKTSLAKQKVVLKDNDVNNIMPKINKILEVHLSLDESLFGGDKIVRSLSFVICCPEGCCGCRSAVLRGDHYCNMTDG